MTEIMDKYIFSIEFNIRDYELDSEGIVNNAHYLNYLEHTRHEFCRFAGYSFDQMTKDHIIPVVNRIEIDYKSPLRSGDTVCSQLWIEQSGPRFIFHQDLYNKSTNKLSARALVSIVSLENDRLSRGDKLAKVFAPYIYKQS